MTGWALSLSRASMQAWKKLSGRDTVMAPGAPDGHGLELFRAHYRADAAAAGSPVFIIHDAGKKASIFPGGGDAGDTEFIAQLLQEGIRGFVYVLAPQVGGVPEFHCVVVVYR